MAVDGNWNITMTTPMGERKATLTLKNSGGTLTGTQGADGNSAEIFDGTVSGDDVAWKVSITNPMPLTLEFTGKVSGDSMSGEMGIGPMGSFPFTGRGPHSSAGGRAASSRLPSIPCTNPHSFPSPSSFPWPARHRQTPRPNRPGAPARSRWCRLATSRAKPIGPTMPGKLAISPLPANSNDPKPPAGVFAPRRCSSSRLPNAMRLAGETVRNRRRALPTPTTKSSQSCTPSSHRNARRFPRAPSPAISAPGPTKVILRA